MALCAPSLSVGTRSALAAATEERQYKKLFRICAKGLAVVLREWLTLKSGWDVLVTSDPHRASVTQASPTSRSSRRHTSGRETGHAVTPSGGHPGAAVARGAVSAGASLGRVLATSGKRLHGCAATDRDSTPLPPDCADRGPRLSLVRSGAQEISEMALPAGPSLWLYFAFLRAIPPSIYAGRIEEQEKH